MKVNGIKMNPNIFHAYDIRGVYPEDLNDESANLIGQAFAVFLRQKYGSQNGKLRVVVGRDNRLSSPALHKNLIQGLIKMGADIIDIGLATTPIFYFAVAHCHYDGGIMITASHNPRQYNGFKVVGRGAVPISEANGLKEILRLIQAGLGKGNGRGKLIQAHARPKILKDYVAFNLKGVDKKSLKLFKIVIDTANAVSGVAVAEIFKNLPCKISHIFKKSDGNFPNYDPDPLVEKNLNSLRSEVVLKQADLGVAFDGDGDRIFFVDEKGDIINGSAIAALLNTSILKNHPGEKILYDIRSSLAVSEAIQKNGGVPVIYRVGHSFIKDKMRKDGIFFGSEISGHYYHQGHYFCEAPFFVLFTVLQEMGKKTLSELVRPYQKYYHSGEINLEIADKKAAIGRLKTHYADGRLLTIDGLRVDYQDWWFLARASNTEPVLRLVVEAKTKDLLDKKKEELLALLY